jgi:predicted NBD/HSP70 family sugar kinase
VNRTPNDDHVHSEGESGGPLEMLMSLLKYFDPREQATAAQWSFYGLAIIGLLGIIVTVVIGKDTYTGIARAVAAISIVLFGLGIFATLVLGWRVRRNDENKFVSNSGRRIEGRPNQVVIGVRFGRTSVECGMFRVEPSKHRSLGLREIGNSQRDRFSENVSASQKMSAVSNCIARVLKVNSKVLRRSSLLTIGIGSPGWINSDNRTVDRSVGNVPHNTDVAGKLAEKLLQKSRLPSHWDLDEEELRRRIFVDNDVRCVARYFQERHEHNPANFLVFHIGTGIGSAAVLDGSLQRGQHNHAGEIGHVDLGFAGGLENETATKRFLEELGVKCSCPREDSFHLETIVNYKGLERLARFYGDIPEMEKSGVNERRGAQETPYDGIQNRYERVLASITTHMDQTPEFVVRKGLPKLVASGGLLSGLPTEVQREFQSDAYEAYFRHVCKIYLGMLSGAIACLVNIYDVDEVVLTGSLYGRMREAPVPSDAKNGVQGTLQSMVQERLVPGRPVVFDFQDVREGVWKGAAYRALELSKSERVSTPQKSA